MEVKPKPRVLLLKNGETAKQEAPKEKLWVQHVSFSWKHPETWPLFDGNPFREDKHPLKLTRISSNSDELFD